jgi:predicted nucleic acid-binding Zn ribbon protein
LWNEIIDNNIKKHTKAVSFKDGKLFVEVESSTLRNELLFKKMQYINELNNKIGERAVENIVFINRRAQ